MSIIYAVITFIILVWVIGIPLGWINMPLDFFAKWGVPSIIIGLLISINHKLSKLLPTKEENHIESVSNEEIKKELELENKK
ncbi:hypothetical protein [Caldalkalibacillus salinus]|uniref:hypothetical protein n=1 Tax=Caldalkalibacillus salinus TaxID=2803787 RepID=UPI0019219893|nr:hypothetical protein [Caldalkalibacillus salinus]